MEPKLISGYVSKLAGYRLSLPLPDFKFEKLKHEDISNKHLCSIELGSIKCNLETAEIRRKTWQLLSRHCQMEFAHL